MDIMETAMAFQKSRVLLTAYELGLFTALSAERKTSSEIAKTLRTNTRAADRLMNALVALGFLAKKNGCFSNTPLSLKFLNENSPLFIRGLAHTVKMWDTWSTLTETVRKGSAVMNADMTKRGKEWFKDFIPAMHERATHQANSIAKLIGISNGMKILDVGGGSGAYSMAFVRQKPGVRAVVFDLPNVTILAKNYIALEKLSNRIKTVSGNYNTDEFPEGFDIVFLSAIIHINSPRENILLLKKAAKALKPGGRVIVQDFIMDEPRTSPVYGALFALNMLVATKHGDTYTASETGEWMKKCGFVDIKRKDTAFGTSIVFAKKT